MGIKGIYNEIGPGERIALSKLAVEFLERKRRPLRLAIDISIWLFQIQAGEGGSNPALRTFYYRLLRLISLSIHPLFVFDGPNKPPFKRHKRTTGPGVKTASIPEFLAKKLLQNFALPIHFAPGEAEAECALLQRLGYVDAVLSEDADTLMFGSGITIRNLSPEGSLKTKVATHVNVYDAEKVRNTSGLDHQGMILVALMSGGDYIPEGIPGCGPKIACQAARAGFGSELCRIERNDDRGLCAWKKRLEHELQTNENKFFSRKNRSLKIPDDFPRRDILRFYTHPCVSSERTLSDNLAKELRWDRDINIRDLRTFAAEAFEWFYVSGAKKFIRNLAPALLAKELRLRGSRPDTVPDDVEGITRYENCMIKSIHLKRNHVSTDQTTELRVGFIPSDLVVLDLDSETPDPQTTNDVDSDEEEIKGADVNEEPSSPKKKRGSSTYDPTSVEKVWLLETIVKLGAPLKVQDWEESVRATQSSKSSKARTGELEKSPMKQKDGEMPRGALDRFTDVLWPASGQNTTRDQGLTPRTGLTEIRTDAQPSLPGTRKPKSSTSFCSRPKFRIPEPLPTVIRETSNAPLVSLLSTPEQSPGRPRIRRSQSDTSIIEAFEKGNDTRSTELNHSSSSRILEFQTDLESVSELPASITTRRSRSPIWRSKTTSNDTADSFYKATTVPCAIQAEFQKPYYLPPSSSRALRRSSKTTHWTSTSTSMPRAQNDPHEPMEIISLCSSPTTPGRDQKPIGELKCLCQTSAVASDPPSNLAEGSLSVISAGTLPERRREIPKKEANTSRRLPLAEAAASQLNGSLSLQTHQKSNELPKTIPASKDIIRLRESLEGSWHIQKASGTEAALLSGLDDEDGQGRKRKRTEWRISQVEVLDLTNV